MPRSAKSNDIFFVTLTIVGWIDIFTRNDYRQLIIDNLNYCRKHKALRVFSLCHYAKSYTLTGNG
jgi:putative transposase